MTFNKNSNTDAHSSIAGYHKQIYVAVELLTQLEDDEASVGVECGADVVCFFQDGTFSSREVKFYKRPFSKFDQEICKTIYNFYNNSYQSVNLTFDSNSRMSSPDFQSIQLHGKEDYIKECLVRHCISNVEPCRMNFEKFRIENNYNKSDALSKIIKGNYIQFSNIDMKNKIHEFSKKLNFRFENLTQQMSYLHTKNRIINLLKAFVKKHMSLEIEEGIYSVITHKLADEFYETCIKNSNIGSENISYSCYDTVSVKRLKEIISDYSSYIDRYREDIVFKKMVGLLEVIIESEIVNEYKAEMELYNDYIGKYKVFNRTTLKEYVETIGKTFANSHELKLFGDRFSYYSNGLGIVGLITKLDISRINIFEDRLFIEHINGKRYRFGNDNLYNLDQIISYTERNKRQSNQVIDYAILNDVSLTYFKTALKKYLIIKKESTVSDTLSDLVHSAEMEKLKGIMKKILVSRMNCLVVGGPAAETKALFNATVNFMEDQANIISFYEDSKFKLNTEMNITHIILEDIEYEDRVKKLNTFTDMIANYDYKFFSLDNYVFTEDSLLEAILSFQKKHQGFFTAIVTSPPDKHTTIDEFLGDLQKDHEEYGRKITFNNIYSVIILRGYRIEDIDYTVIDRIYIKDSFEQWNIEFKHLYHYERKD